MEPSLETRNHKHQLGVRGRLKVSRDSRELAGSEGCGIVPGTWRIAGSGGLPAWHGHAGTDGPRTADRESDKDKHEERNHRLERPRTVQAHRTWMSGHKLEFLQGIHTAGSAGAISTRVIRRGHEPVSRWLSFSSHKTRFSGKAM